MDTEEGVPNFRAFVCVSRDLLGKLVGADLIRVGRRGDKCPSANTCFSCV